MLQKMSVDANSMAISYGKYRSRCVQMYDTRDVGLSNNMA